MRSAARSSKQKPSCSMKMEGKDLPRLLESPDGVKTVRPPLMIPHNAEEGVIFVTVSATGPQGAGKILKQKRLKDQIL